MTKLIVLVVGFAVSSVIAMTVQTQQGSSTTTLQQRSTKLQQPSTAKPQEAKSMPTQYNQLTACLLYTSPSPRDRQKSRMPSSA